MAFSPLMTSAAAAPSESGELLPAVTEPLVENAGLSDARPSAVVSGRGRSSTLKSKVFFSLPAKRMPCTVTISLSKTFFSIAADAFFWLSSANASCCSRVMPNFAATFSAVMPIGV